MNKLFTVFALLGLAALAVGGGLLAGFSGDSSEARIISSPIAASHSLKPSTGPEVVLPAPACTGAVPSALRVARFERPPISSDAAIDSVTESSAASSRSDVAKVAEIPPATHVDLAPESTETSAPVEISAVSETASATDFSSAKAPGLNGSRRLPTLTSNVNPVALGNSFTHNGQRISVADVSHSPGGEVAGIDLQSAPESSATARNQQQASSKTPSANRQQASNKKPSSNRQKSAKSPYKTGLTYEEELFRTKWGWDAFAQAQSLGNHQ